MQDEGRALRLYSNDTALEFDRGSGAFEISVMGEPVFEGARAIVEVGGQGGARRLSPPGDWEVLEAGASAFTVSGKDGEHTVIFDARSEDGALVIRVGVTWEGDGEPPRIESMAPLATPVGGVWPLRRNTRSWRFYQNGWQCWTPSGTLRHDRPGDYLYPLFMPRAVKAMIANITTPVSSEKGRFTSEWFAGLADLDRGDSVVVGFAGVTRALSQVSARIAGRRVESELWAFSQFEGKPLASGEEAWSEPLAVIPGDLTGRSLERYADMVAAEQGVSEVRRGPVGWCSWYQYFTAVTREKVEQNLGLLSDTYSGLGIELIQIDDGYQAAVGDWLETNADFPGGMKELAGEIAERGKIPGVWVAPFTVIKRSRTFKEKKDWLLSDRKGKPLLAGVNPLWGGRFYGLDITNPEVLERIREVFEGVAAAGFKFVKLDFLATAMLEGERFDRSLTRAEAFRRALEVIREAVGPETYLIAAGGPILLGTGVFDAQRVSGDVAPGWRAFYQPLIRDRATPGVRNCLINVLTRYFMSNRLFEGDPDCLMLRESDTRLTLPERRTLASAIALFGGSFILSDDLGLWGEGELEMAARVLPHVRGNPFVPDIWKSEVPRFMVSRLEDPGGHYYSALIMNWSSAKKTMNVSLSELGVEPGKYHAHEFWTGRYLGEVVDVFRLVHVPAHGCAMVRLTPFSDAPRLVGSDIHVLQGAAELKRFKETPLGVWMTFTGPVDRTAEIALSLPRQARVESINGMRSWKGDAELRRDTRTVYRLRFELDGPTEVELVWL
jgi:alpha-galactosidase